MNNNYNETDPNPEEKGDFKGVLKEDDMNQEKKKTRFVKPEVIV